MFRVLRDERDPEILRKWENSQWYRQNINMHWHKMFSPFAETRRRYRDMQDFTQQAWFHWNNPGYNDCLTPDERRMLQKTTTWTSNQRSGQTVPIAELLDIADRRQLLRGRESSTTGSTGGDSVSASRRPPMRQAMGKSATAQLGR